MNKLHTIKLSLKNIIIVQHQLKLLNQNKIKKGFKRQAKKFNDVV